jgi:hypothetical protein
MQISPIVEMRLMSKSSETIEEGISLMPLFWQISPIVERTLT